MAFRPALDPPEGNLSILTRAVRDRAVAYSRQSPRLRVIQPFHRSERETLHRMFNAVQPGSYIRPHRHLQPPKAEAWIVLQGAVAFFTFDDDGATREIVGLSRDGEAFGVDLSPGVYHTFIALEPDTVIFEVKDGPYVAATDKSFAPWAPAEGAPEAAAYLARLYDAARAVPAT
jgi:cupin fold WbuC family metalloprotein